MSTLRNLDDPFKDFNKKNPRDIIFLPLTITWWLVIKGFDGFDAIMNKLQNHKLHGGEHHKHDKID